MTTATLAHDISGFLPVDALLGGRGVLSGAPRSSLEWVSLIRDGIPVAAVESIKRAVALSQAELAPGEKPQLYICLEQFRMTEEILDLGHGWDRLMLTLIGILIHGRTFVLNLG